MLNRPKDKIEALLTEHQHFGKDEYVLTATGQKLVNSLLALLTEARVEEVKNYTSVMTRSFATLCQRVSEDPNLGNSTKSKKHNFLDGAEIILTDAQAHRFDRIKELKSE